MADQQKKLKKKQRKKSGFVLGLLFSLNELGIIYFSWLKRRKVTFSDHSFLLKKLDTNGHKSNTLKKKVKRKKNRCTKLLHGKLRKQNVSSLQPIHRPVQANQASEMEIVLFHEVFSFNVAFSSSSSSGSAKRSVFWKMCLRACSCITVRSADLDPVQQKERCL